MTHSTVPPCAPAGRRVVIMGGGLAGMLAAAAWSGLADDIRIVEPDELPDGAAPRRGLPQASHVHLMWSGGVRAVEALLPGITARWLEAGARRIPIPTGMVGLSAQGWFRRWLKETHFLIACSRDLLDAVVRREVLRSPAVRVVRARVQGLTGTAERVTGVRVRYADGREGSLEATFVVDATGRGSRAPRYLREIGAGAVAERTVDSGLVYASCLFRAPPGAEEFPVVMVQADPRAARPGRSAGILPIEDDQWLVTVSGTRGGEPSGRPEEFEPFARTVRHPIVGELIAGLEPLGGVAVSRSTGNRRRYFERAAHWPEGFVVLGDAVAAFNPVYGHGMSVAAQGALAMRGQLRASRDGTAGADLARRIQRVVARPVATAWDMATGQDSFYPEARGRTPNVADRVLARYVDRLVRATTGSFVATKRFTDVSSLQSPVTALVSPRLLLAAALGPLRPPLTGPPLTAGEYALVTAHAARRPQP